MKTKNIEDIYELTSIQQGFLFHSLYAPGAGTYVEHVSFTFKGKLDVKSFCRAWETLIKRHSILRTAIHMQEIDKPLQVVHRHAELSLEELDWCHLPADEQEQRYAAFLKEDRRRGFDLTQPPLMRLTLIKLDADTFKCAWRFLHIVMDGWSFSVALQELIFLYKAYWNGHEPGLLPVRPYRDYVAWWKRQEPSKAEAFWREQFRGFVTPEPLQMGGVDNLSDGITHHWEELQLDDIAEHLRLVGQQGQLTQNTLFQAAWTIVLSRYTGEDDVVIGSTVAHRPSELINITTESMLGPALVTLPIRAQLQLNEPLLSWLQQFQKYMAAIRERANASLVQIHEWSGLPQSTPLFESTVAFENSPSPEGTLQDEGLEVMDVVYDGRPHYPLTLTVFPGPIVRLVYERRRFERSVIIRLLGNLKTVLTGIANNPHQCLGELNLLTPQERQQLDTYGSSKTNVRATYQRIVAENLSSDEKIVIDSPLPDLKIYLVNKHLQLVPIGAKGEICVAGDGMTQGCLNQPELTEQRFVANPFSNQPGTRMYRSGELARYREDGELEFLGHAGDQVEMHGLNLTHGQQEESVYVVPSTPTEECLVEILEELLDVPNIGVRDNLLDLGLHSLLATRILIRIRKALKADIPLRVLFEMPTVEALAQLIDSSAAEERASNFASMNAS